MLGAQSDDGNGCGALKPRRTQSYEEPLHRSEWADGAKAAHGL